MLRRIHDPDRGANFVEYGAVILLIAAIASMVADTSIHLRVTDMIERSLAGVSSESGNGDGQSPPGLADDGNADPGPVTDPTMPGYQPPQQTGLGDGTPTYQYIRDDGSTPGDDGMVLAPGDENMPEPLGEINEDDPAVERFLDALITSAGGDLVGAVEGIWELFTTNPIDTIVATVEAIAEDPLGLILSDELRDAWERGDWAAVIGHGLWDFGTLLLGGAGIAIKALRLLGKVPDANGPSPPRGNDPDGQGSEQEQGGQENDPDEEESNDPDRADCTTGNSFVPGTPVLLADGTTQPIEDVQVGDEVLAFDPRTGEEGARPVTGTITGDGPKTLVTITVEAGDGATDTVTATDEHPFWAPESAEWVDAIDLTPGTWLRTSTGAWAQVAAVEVDTAEGRQVHNLTVDDLHTYHVATAVGALLVHNDEDCIPGPERSYDDHGLRHSFDRHASEWFGGQPTRTTHMQEWTDMIETGMRSTQVVEWSSGSAPTYGHLARIDGKYFFVQFHRETGSLVTAFRPSNSQLTSILRKLRE